MILRNEKGPVIFADYRQLLYCNNALEAEIHAILEALASHPKDGPSSEDPICLCGGVIGDPRWVFRQNNIWQFD